MKNLKRLDEIATANGGNRAFGLPGYDASVDYVLSKVSDSKSYRSWTQDFPGLYNNVESITFRVGDTEYYVFGPTYSPSTSPEGVTAQLLLGPNGTTACTVDGYEGLDVTDKMVLVQRGTCPDGTTIAESKGGDEENVIMLGAHLDSVKAGAGINDDGSGSTLLLEIFAGLQRLGFRNKIRLAWWGAEENGLVGSKYYTSQINNTAEADNLLLYLNFDMVSRGYFGVFDGDGSTHGLAGAPGSDVIEKLFVDHLTSKGINVTAAVFTGGSDYASFMSTLNKPVGGLHTGTGVAQDDCYHQACDTYDNANPTTLTINAKAVAHVLATLATDGQDLIPKGAGNVTAAVRPRALGSMSETELFPWTVAEGERHTGCGGDV